MSIQLFGLHDRPHNIAVTKIDVPLEDCVFLLDFSRPLEKFRWFGVFNKWVGITAGFLVPIVHQSGESDGFKISVSSGEPYFIELPKLWKQHHGSKRTMVTPQINQLEIIADFGRHFPSEATIR